MSKLCSLFAAALTVACAADPRDPDSVVRARYTDDLDIMLPITWDGDQAVFEGDIVIPMQRTDGVVEQAATAIGTNVSNRWPSGIVPFTIAADLHDDLRPRIDAAIAEWHGKTNIRFVERTTQANYVVFKRSNASGDCRANIGMWGHGAQSIWLGNHCSTAAVIHEFGHAIGLWHEQARGDRDQHVRIHAANIEPGQEHNFQRVDQQTCVRNTDNAEVPCTEVRLTAYDLSSRMHYSSFAFSTNGQPTITRLDGSQITPSPVLSQLDVVAVNAMYPVNPPPSRVTAGAVSANQVWLTWPAVNHADLAGYIVRRNGTVVLFRDKSGGTSFVDDHLAESTLLTYEVFAYDRWGRWSRTAAQATTFTPAGPNRRTALWRYWGANATDHYYTINRNDVGLAAYGYAFETAEGSVFRNHEFGTTPVYQYWNGTIGDHFYTTSWSELGGGNHGYVYEGTPFYIFPKQYAGTVPLYRYWNGTDHYYTRQYAPGGFFGYAYENILGYVYQ